MKRTVDVNSDMGESFGRWELGDDTSMLKVVSSANVACGFHAGDPERIRSTLSQAAANGVAVGAHVAYRDLAGFGRRYLDATPSELAADVLYQIGALKALAQSEGASVRYVKPHGALYNTIAYDERHGRAVIDAIGDVDPSLVLMGLAGAPILDWARTAGLRTVAEAFVDRGYQPDGQLVSRREPGAVFDDPLEVADRMVGLVTTGRLKAVDGSDVEIAADSLCVHSDSPGAVDMAQAVVNGLTQAGIAVRSFVG